MKKLMIAAFAVAIAAIAQAATVSWNTGTLYLPAADGSFDMTMKATAANIGTGSMLATVTFYADNNGSCGDIMSVGGKLSSDTPNTMGGLNGTTGDAFATSTKYWMSAVITYTDESGKIFTLDLDATQFTTKGTGSTTANMQQNTVFASKMIDPATSKWESIPEPTSALMLLVGLAGLALKRKVA